LRRRSGCIAWFVIFAAIVALFLTWQYFDYRSASRTLPDGMRVADLSVGEMTREEALNVLEVTFATPMEVMYQEQQLILSPEHIELRYHAEETAANLDAALAERIGLDGFIGHVLRRPSDVVDVPVVVSYSEERLDSFLVRVAGQHDHPPQAAVPLPASRTFRPAQPGSKLDIEASHARLADALVSVADRRVELVVQSEEAPPTALAAGAL
jgi:hypothetical protein